MSKAAFPLPVHTFWAQLSICCLGIIWVLFLLHCLYKFIRGHPFVLRSSFPFTSLITQRRLLDENIPDNSFELASRGLSSELLRSLPLVMFKKEKKEDGSCSDSECAICLVEFGDGEMQRVLPNCLHMFHVHCIDTWLRSRSDCPLCREKVVCDSSDFSSISMAQPLETLTREDPLRYHVLESDRVALHLPFAMVGI